MSALLLRPAPADAAAGGAVETGAPGERALLSLARQGFGHFRSWRVGDLELLWAPSPSGADREELWVPFANGVACCVGTMFYRGAGGAEALARLQEDFTGPMATRDASLSGNYVVALVRGSTLWTFGDTVGMLRLYRAEAERVYSTSWLACIEAVAHRRLDRLGTIDYVISGANHGTRTPVLGVETCDPTAAHEHVSNRSHPISTPAQWLALPAPASPELAVEQCGALLSERARTIANAFDGKVNAALSGGFDSRLILAMMLDAGCRPRLHVYGSSADEDVTIASRICAGLGIPLHHVDKSAKNALAPPLTPDALDAQMRFFDGIPIDGIFDTGVDRDTRLAQSADGAIALNGGGGEVLRNFFYLDDRRFTARQIVGAFYCNFSPSVLRRREDAEAYLEHLASTLARQVGEGATLTRRQVELAYALFRNRFWTARNNSLAARCGAFLTPLLDPALISLSNSLPLAWKDYGRFESRLIGAMNPALGRFPLSYGFTPQDGPGPAYRAKMWLQHRRPPWLREHAVRIKAALGRARPVRRNADLERLVPNPECIGAIFDLDGFFDEAQLMRAFTLEHVARCLSISEAP